MHLEVRHEPRGTVVQCSGPVDPRDAPVLSGQLRKAFVDDPACVVCDLSRVQRLNPVCSSVFVAVAAERSWPGPPLVLADGPESVRSILQTTGTTRFVALRDSVEAAFAAAAESPPRAREVLLGSADLVAAHRARAFAAEVCRRWGLESLADTTALVVSELVTNIVRHVGGDFELRLERRGGLLRIAVRDWGPGLRRWPDPPSQPLVESGAGLMIVSAMSQFHGTAVHPGGGNVVWAALRAEPEETEPEPAERVTAERVLDESPSGAWRVMLTVQWLPSRPQVIELRVAGEPAHPALPSGKWLIRRDALARGLQIPTQTSGVWLVPDTEAGLVTLRLPLDQPVAVPISWFRRLLEQTGS